MQQAHSLLQAGDAAGAARAISGVSPAASSNPDALLLAAQILIAQGRLADARRTLEGAVAIAPDHPGALIELGSLLLDLGEHRAAAAVLEHAITLVPGEASIWTLLGMAHQGLGDQSLAETQFHAALKIAPNDKAARHNLAASLRIQDRAEDALAEIGKVSSPPVETQTLRAHLLTELGRFDEAVEQYRAVIAQHPAHLDAQETLARLLPQVGRGDEALEDYRQSLSTSRDPALWLSAISAAKDLKQAEPLIEWSKAAQIHFGADPSLQVAHAIGQSLLGERVAAIDALRQLARVHPDEPALHMHLAPWLIAEGDLASAEMHATRATVLAPHDQSGWAWLSIIWRLNDDPREHWLADYQRLVMPTDLALDADLAETLTALHLTHTHPAEQSVRGGTQTRGNLFDRQIPQIRALADQIKHAVEAQLATLKPDSSHPFLSRLAGNIAFAGSWSVRLASSGFHTSHIHQAGWLSSALYVSLPNEIDATHGALAFGVPDDTLGLDLTPRRTITPQAGTLVIFPSYFWHGTLPFESDTRRLTVAFDALPG